MHAMVCGILCIVIADCACGQAGAAGQGTTAQPPAVGVKPGTPGFTVPGATPWFGNPVVMRELRLNDDQARRLNDAHGQLFDRFKDRFGKLESVNPNDRMARAFELHRTFGTDLAKSAGEILDKQQMQRFNQLHLQQQGFNVFQDLQLQRQLSLTEQQVQQLRKAALELDSQFREFPKGFSADEATRRMEMLSRQRLERLNGIFNEQQRQTWRDMTGEPFIFPPTFTTPVPPAPPRP